MNINAAFIMFYFLCTSERLQKIRMQRIIDKKAKRNMLFA